MRSSQPRDFQESASRCESLENLIQKNMINLPPSLTEHEQVESLAYRLYEGEGNPDGRADEHWARAEEVIHSQRLVIGASSEKSEA